MASRRCTAMSAVDRRPRGIPGQRRGQRADTTATNRRSIAAGYCRNGFVDELRRRYATDWPTIWGTVWSHREACMIAALRALDAALSEPKATRQGIRRQILAAFAAIAAHGPEAVPPRTRRD